MNINRTAISNLVSAIQPLDDQEAHDQSAVMQWIASGAELFRRQRPDVPKQHLVSYCVLVDYLHETLLLMDHRTSGLWLPTGGHVELGEDPRTTVVRELAEELGPAVVSAATIAPWPLFITVNQTVGAGTHTDVSLWYVVAADQAVPLAPEVREFADYRWLRWDNIETMPIERLDRQMHRFVYKLRLKRPGPVP